MSQKFYLSQPKLGFVFISVKIRNELTTILATLLFAAGANAKSPSEPLNLSRYLELVQHGSPDLEANKSNLQAARARSEGIRIPPPMVGFMRMSEAANSNALGALGIEISQEVPFPTKIIQEKKVRRLEAESIASAVSAANALVLADARLAFVSYWSTQERLKVLKEKGNWLRRHAKLARTMARYDSESQIYLLNLESQVDTTENEVLAADADLAEQRSALQVFAPGLPVLQIETTEPELTDLSLDSHTSPLVQAREKEAGALGAMKDLSKSSYLPDFFLRYRSFNSDGMIPSSQEGMIGVSLPFIFFWQPRADVAEASAKQGAAEAELRKAKIISQEQANGLLQKAQAVRAQHSNLKSKLTPKSEQRIRLIRNISQRTLAGLQQHNEVVLADLELKLAAVGLRLEYERISREITNLTGR